MKTTEIWTAQGDSAPTKLKTRDPVCLTHSGPRLLADGAVPESDDAVVLVPIDPAYGLCGTALVPEKTSGRAGRNGVRLGPGMHLLRHRDRIDLNGHTAWMAVTSLPEEVAYDPQIHGERMFCLRTKSRLQPGDLIIVCPGPPESECGMLYKASAWAVEAPCHHCGAAHSQTAWVPPSQTQRNRLAELFQLSRGV